MKNIEEFVPNIEILKEHEFPNFKLTTLRFEQDIKQNYIPFETAYQKDLCRVKELGPRGSVTQVVFLNNSNEFIFVSEGTCLVGAKQNRTFAKSFIAAPKTSIEVPVNCIERGRWENTRDLSFQPN